jgi:hypothetical protein
MVNPMKVLNFMDISGAWDATLIFVMVQPFVTDWLPSHLQTAPCLRRRSD